VKGLLTYPDLPIVDVLPELLERLEHANRVIVDAPPGTGKSTIVPIALLNGGWGSKGRIIMLEPRRLAARATAARMAAILGERVGNTVGYRVRMDTRVSDATKIEVVTEGVLTRMLQTDPMLDGTSVVVFDEYHERSLHTDLGLVLTLDAQRAVRPDLRIVVMSATLDREGFGTGLSDAPVVAARTAVHDVTVRYHPVTAGGRLTDHVVQAVSQAWNEEPGDVLVFLPGEREIRGTVARLTGVLPGSAAIHPLYGSLSTDAQEAAITPDRAGRRKVVLATNIAETSLTIEGIRIVIDSGLARRPRWSAATGLDALDTVRVSEASATQRAGRAGRMGPGTCIRLWSPLEQEHLIAHDPPAIRTSDLASLALEVCCWGEREYTRLPWPEEPPAHHFAAAVELLQDLGAIDSAGLPTAHGRLLARFPLHPRLAHMIASAPDTDRLLGLRIAAMIGERDPFRSANGFPEPDIAWRHDAIWERNRHTDDRNSGRKRIRQVADQLGRIARRMSLAFTTESARVSHKADAPGRLLLEAYPDRVALAENPGTFRMRSGKLVSVPRESRLAGAEAIVAAHLSGRRGNLICRLGARVSRAYVETRFASALADHTLEWWDEAAGRVFVTRRRVLGALVMSESIGPAQASDDVLDVVLSAIREKGLSILPWDEDLRRLKDRAAFARLHEDGFPDVSDEALLESLESWLTPFITEPHEASVLRRVNLRDALSTYLGWDRLARLDEFAPDAVRVASGSLVQLDYSDPQQPVLEVRMQETFGMSDVPRIAGGRVAVTVSLLSPARRPLQITQDLEGFWRGEYAEVRKEMRGRYPKHFWPEDPSSAPAIKGVRPPSSR
jgi:ATP-dependent helicase HrpB